MIQKGHRRVSGSTHSLIEAMASSQETQIGVRPAHHRWWPLETFPLSNLNIFSLVQHPDFIPTSTGLHSTCEGVVVGQGTPLKKHLSAVKFV